VLTWVLAAQNQTKPPELCALRSVHLLSCTPV